MDTSQVKLNAFTDNLGTDWVAVDAQGNVLTRAGDKDTVQRAVPFAAAYFTGSDFEKKPAAGSKAFDHDDDGKVGGSPKGAESTAAKGAAKKVETAPAPKVEAPKAEAPKAEAPAAKPAPKKVAKARK